VAVILSLRVLRVEIEQVCVAGEFDQ
jgi:hypothetical protein